MQTSKTRRFRLASSALLALTLATTAAACGGGDDDSGSDADGVTTISVATFNEFGYEDLIDEWNAANDDIKIKQVKVGTWDDAKANLYTKLAAGSGLSDIEAIEGDAMPAIMAESDAFVDLTDPELDGRWLDWKAAAGTNSDGQMIGYGTDVGPEGICYRADLFKKAGLPSDREEVAELMGTWDDYFATGDEFVKAMPDTAWYDSSGAPGAGHAQPGREPLRDRRRDRRRGEPRARGRLQDGDRQRGPRPVPEDRPVGRRLDRAVPERRLRHDGRARGWMMGIIEGNSEGVDGWDIANVFPGGGGNWGGSFLTVPAQGEHPEEAKKVAAWLTAPEQQAKAFEAVGAFPSQVDAQDSPEVNDAVNEFFNDAPIGTITADRAAAITVQPFKGPKYSDILTAFQAAITRVDDGSKDADASWEQFLADVEALG